jgi:hypothetical protein
VTLRLERRILTERFLAVLGVVLGLLLLGALEACARLLPRPAGSDLERLHRYSEVYGWEPRPGARAGSGDRLVTINDRGYRGREVAARPRPGVTRVVLLGDSIGFGIGVADDETFASLLDGGDLEAVNLAVEGFGPEQSLLRLEREGLAFAPEVVVMNLCLDNDFADAALSRFLYDGIHPKPRFRLESGRLVAEDAHLRLDPGRRFGLRLRESSRLVELMSAALSGPQRKLREHWLDRKERALADRGQAIDLVAALLARMRDVAASRGAGFLVAVHPDKVGFRRRSPWVNSLRRSPRLAGVAVVDMREHYRARGLRFADVALDAVGHLSVRGHREAAEILREEISRAGGRAQGHL